MYEPFVFELDENKKNLTQDTSDVLTTTSIPHPLFSLGFHSFLHRTKSGMNITNNLESNNRFYEVIDEFRPNIKDNNEDLNNHFSKMVKDNNLLTDSFYGIWEILSLFEITEKGNMNVSVLGDGTGAVTQSFLKFRELNNQKNDSVNSVAIKPEKNKYDNMSKSLVESYKKNLKVHKTYTSVTSKKYTSKDTGDITDLKTISLFSDKLKNNNNLVIANARALINDDNYIEQNSYKILLGEIITMLKVIKKGGHFVLRINETFTHSTIKLIYLVNHYFEKNFIYKPYLTNYVSSDKYLVCKNFKYDSKVISSDIKKLEQMLEKIDSNLNVNDIFTDFTLPESFVKIFKYINTNYANNQQILINKIISYIKNNNYFGEEYHQSKDRQIKANRWWLDHFTKTSDIKEILNKRIKYHMDDLNIFLK
jgi:23S rRNA U2552 (ribose-2'-O)-methylase RlmE/FtsJ